MQQTIYSGKKQYKQRNDQQNDNSQKTKMRRKAISWTFQATISHEKTWTWLRTGTLKKEIESLLIAAQNNSIRTNYVKANIDMMQKKITNVGYVVI